MVAWRASDSRGVWSGWLVGLFGLFWLALHGFGLGLGQGFSCELQVNAIGGEMSSRNWGGPNRLKPGASAEEFKDLMKYLSDLSLIFSVSSAINNLFLTVLVGIHYNLSYDII